MNHLQNTNEAMHDKFDFIKFNLDLILCNEEVCEYDPEWSWNDLFRKGDSYGEVRKDADNNGTQEDMAKRAQLAFKYLLEQVKEFDFSRTLDFLVFESLFYQLITNAYRYERHFTQSEKLISIDAAKKCLSESQYQYLYSIYEIVQLGFWYWLQERNRFRKNDGVSNTKGKGILKRGYSTSGTKEYWEKIKELASVAHEFCLEGELANRIMLISDVQLIYCVGEWKDVYDPANAELIKYLDTREDFILSCFSDGFEDYCKPLGWLTGLPHIEGRNTPFRHSSKCRNNAEKKEFLDNIYYDIMLFPASIYFPQMDGQLLTSIAKEIRDSDDLKNAKQELEKRNTALQKAQDDKKQIIAEFAHTYGNMQATTLQDIGTQLLSVDDDLLHEWGRKIMVEYAIKQNLTKEVEMLKLQFEDQSSKLITKLKDSLSDSDGKNITDLISDSLQRCFMSLLYGETRDDKSKRKLFFGTDDYADKREALQEGFEQDVLVGEEDMLTWLKKKNILNVPVDISGNWQKLCFDEGGYAALLITNWITELLTNAIKYADKTKQISLSFSQQNGMLILGIRNIKEQAAINIHGTQQGVSSIKASIRRLNRAVNCNVDTDATTEDHDIYQLQLFLSSKVLIG